MERGEIRWCRFERPNKTRPVLILTRNRAIRALHTVTVAEITTTIRGLSTEVLLTPDDGMLTRCVVNLDYIQSVAQRLIGGFIAVLPETKLLEVRTALLRAMGFDD
jgi:mRNA interferase MazF